MHSHALHRADLCNFTHPHTRQPRTQSHSCMGSLTFETLNVKTLMHLQNINLHVNTYTHGPETHKHTCNTSPAHICDTQHPCELTCTFAHILHLQHTYAHTQHEVRTLVHILAHTFTTHSNSRATHSHTCTCTRITYVCTQHTHMHICHPHTPVLTQQRAPDLPFCLNLSLVLPSCC